jgi:pyruvyl transferase EpsO
LLLREADSLARAQAAFAAPAALCPDLALMLDPPVVRPIPDVDVLWLGRDPGSPEHGGQLAPPAGPGLRRLDWLATLPADEQAWPAPWRALLGVDRWLGRHPGVGAVGAAGRRLQAATFTPLARRWVRRGFDLLGQGRVVVTDTLHGHLLCVLTGQPHVAMDNSYGKVGATWRTWTHACPTARWATSADEAVRLARELLENGTS